MKFIVRAGLTLLACAAATVLAASPATALAGKLDKPDVAYAAGFPKENILKVQAALRTPDCKFLSGSFINSHTSLYYQGESKALAAFLQNVSEVPGVGLSVSFFRPGPLQDAGDGDWHISHDGYSGHFHVRINLESKRLDLEKLTLPQFKQK